MIPVDLVVGAPMAAALGFAYGMGPCLVSCAPFLAPVFLANPSGTKKSWKIILPLSLGRLLGYAAFGATAGWLGLYLKGGIGTDAIRATVGSAALLIGMALLLRRTTQPACGTATTGQSIPLRRMDTRNTTVLMPSGLFVMGLGMALSPCTPLGVVLFSAAASLSAWHGLWLGLSFGLGAIVIPAIVFGVGVAYVGTRLRERLQDWLPYIEKLSAVMLIVVGVSNLLRI